jgi:hypothetical protein
VDSVDVLLKTFFTSSEGGGLALLKMVRAKISQAAADYKALQSYVEFFPEAEADRQDNLNGVIRAQVQAACLVGLEYLSQHSVSSVDVEKVALIVKSYIAQECVDLRETQKHIWGSGFSLPSDAESLPVSPACS